MQKPRIKPLDFGGRRLFRVGPIYCNEIRGDIEISYDVDDVADWDKLRAEAIKAATEQ
jgi:hypothetical protein